MATDYIDIGSTPADEECAQVGSPDYARRAREECNRFINLIRHVVGPEPEGARLTVKSNPHDFGTYYEVVCYYDTENEEARKYAYRCERDAPTRWEPAPAVSPPDQVCDSCLATAAEQGVPDRETQAMLMMEMGGEVEDHRCDAVEVPGTPCRCGCRSRSRR
jgi:hypothetical protein